MRWSVKVCFEDLDEAEKGAGWKTSVVSRVPMTSMFLLESRMSEECAEVAVTLMVAR